VFVVCEIPMVLAELGKLLPLLPKPTIHCISVREVLHLNVAVKAQRHTRNSLSAEPLPTFYFGPMPNQPEFVEETSPSTARLLSALRIIDRLDILFSWT
jgi:hypothetical protein